MKSKIIIGTISNGENMGKITIDRFSDQPAPTRFKALFEPRSVAILGVSRSNPFHPANVIYNKNHLRHRARAFCINPAGGTLYGEPIYRNIGEVPEPVDLAILCIRAEMVPQALEECALAGVSGALIISGGFSETGRIDLEEQIRAISIRHSLPFIGPNCLGIFSPPHVDAFFLPPERLVAPEPGAVALVSQSGGILVDLMLKLTEEDCGIAKAVSIGNKAAIDEVDLLEHFEQDPQVRVIGLYVEGFKQGRGRRFVETVRGMTKPVVVLKSGKTPGGTRAVKSHTASLAGDYVVFSELIKQAGALEAADETEFVSYCEALACCPGHHRARNVCIVTGSGGHGAMAADACFDKGLNVVDIPEDDRGLLREGLSPSVQAIASVGNPIDLTGSATDADFLSAVRFCLAQDYVDSVVVLLLPYLPGITSDVGARLATAVREHQKPLVTYIPHVEKYGIFIEGFEANGIPVAHSAAGAVYMIESLSGRNK